MKSYKNKYYLSSDVYILMILTAFVLIWTLKGMNPQDSYFLGGPPRPLPLPGPGEGPLAFPGGPLLGPGARVTGALGLGAASDTSFCRLTPLAAATGFILGDLLPFSITTSEMAVRIQKGRWGQTSASWLIVHDNENRKVRAYQVGAALPLRWEVGWETYLAADPPSLSSPD